MTRPQRSPCDDGMESLGADTLFSPLVAAARNGSGVSVPQRLYELWFRIASQDDAERVGEIGLAQSRTGCTEDAFDAKALVHVTDRFGSAHECLIRKSRAFLVGEDAHTSTARGPLEHHDDVLDTPEPSPVGVEEVARDEEGIRERQRLVMPQLEICQTVERMRLARRRGCSPQHIDRPWRRRLLLPRILAVNELFNLDFRFFDCHNLLFLLLLLLTLLLSVEIAMLEHSEPPHLGKDASRHLALVVRAHKVAVCLEHVAQFGFEWDGLRHSSLERVINALVENDEGILHRLFGFLDAFNKIVAERVRVVKGVLLINVGHRLEAEHCPLLLFRAHSHQHQPRDQIRQG
mmetsp:Transcript_8184/g.27174  ORF Transcript_8184/g.27174 Transcript_8184/m.27174 type:complete len:348 (-) Transcript_8184:10754-11797(-)